MKHMGGRDVNIRTMLLVAGTATLAISAFLVPMQLVQAAKQTQTTATTTQVLPNLKPVRETLMDNDLVYDPVSGKMLLRFAGGIGNYGPGKIEIVGRSDPSLDSTDNVLRAFQRVYNTGGTYTEVPVGILNYHSQHHHYHFVNAVKYSLVDPSNNNVVVTA